VFPGDDEVVPDPATGAGLRIYAPGMDVVIEPDGRRFAEQLRAEGVSLWLAGLHRGVLADGSLADAVDCGRVVGAVSEAAVLAAELSRQDSPYREQLQQLASRRVVGEAALTALHAYDARWACDALAGVFAATGGRDGLVSVELPEQSAAAALELQRAVGRPAMLVRVPAGALTLVEECLSRGVGVEATDVVSAARYREVLEAWIGGLRAAAAKGLDLSALSSLASVPLGEVERAAGREAARSLARSLYRIYEERLGEPDWAELSRAGARPQRLLWIGIAEARQVTEYVAWNTVLAAPAEVLEAARTEAEMTGDTLSGHSKGEPEPVPGLESELDARRRAAWEALRSLV
jgi:transaldolase